LDVLLTMNTESDSFAYFNYSDPYYFNAIPRYNDSDTQKFYTVNPSTNTSTYRLTWYSNKYWLTGKDRTSALYFDGNNIQPRHALYDPTSPIYINPALNYHIRLIYMYSSGEPVGLVVNRTHE